ncbi:malto-oligosyltrehalose trehalohydrolase [Rhizobium grahamii]|uniref:Malto-oligosyltrehalose trehalohydrolase n=1 Tax=Rhizobium grahamii CCGE 502 TaxID=990285 RepID=S3HC41_9HYPH|nr:malto-oligosyltrehalose trehalohydrolase [Rhizobium grahamii]EPE96282.1 TreZ [Rhizobium grahamii CCGE 502]
MTKFCSKGFAWGPSHQEDGTLFRLWAPGIETLALRVGSVDVAMDRRDDGWFEILIGDLPSQVNYSFILPDGTAVPDPASRYQLGDVGGPSILVDPNVYDWKHPDWQGRAWEESVIYELHVGTFTEDGTFRAAAERLGLLADLGITAIEVMPVAHFPGDRGWGYDGVLHYAPHNSYGTPADFKAFIDTAHGLGLMVFLDVVYNHFGPEGNYLPTYAPPFFRSDDPTPWGPRIAFDQLPVRQYFIENVIYWLAEFRLDGLRLDAIDQIDDECDPHILQEISDTVSEQFNQRHVHLIVENPVNGTDMIAERDGRPLFKADWNDDFHHALHVLATGESSGYYAPFKDAPWVKLRHALARGYVREGVQKLPGAKIPTNAVAPTSFVHFLQNHDQVGNRAEGNRLYSMVGVDKFRIFSEILLLSPQIPLIFMGDDHLSSRPFQFFTDYKGQLAQAIRENRPEEAKNFGCLFEDIKSDAIVDPNSLKAFHDSKLLWSEAFLEHRRRWRKWLAEVVKVRRDHVVPLLIPAKGNSGKVVESLEQCLFIVWQLHDHQLHLRANLSDHEVECDMPSSTQIYPVAARKDATLPPMSVSAFIKAPTR